MRISLFLPAIIQIESQPIHYFFISVEPMGILDFLGDILWYLKIKTNVSSTNLAV
jgi:hypothetical protein